MNRIVNLNIFEVMNTHPDLIAINGDITNKYNQQSNEALISKWSQIIN